MTRRNTYLACAGAAIALAAPAHAAAAPTAVNLRIEGTAGTVFDGPVTTDGKQVTTASGGTHQCDGTNGGANPTPGPTPTTALDDGSKTGAYTWDGRYFSSFNDYLVERIGSEVNGGPPDYPSWGVFLNGTATQAGGCQVRIAAGDEVLWAYDAFSKAGVSKLTGPEAVVTGQPAQVRVTDAATNAPIGGATVGAATTDGQGFARVSYDQPGVYRLKSEKADRDGGGPDSSYIRSRTYTLCVDPPQADPCTTGDKAAPGVRLDVPPISSSLSRFGSVRASWQGDDGAGSGIRRYRVQYRRADGNGSAWKPLENDSAVTQGAFRGSQGGAYEVRVQAFDKASNASVQKQGLSLVPLDDLSDRLSLSRQWRQLKRQGAYQRSVSRSSAKGARASLKFEGSRVALITRKLPKGGRVRVSVDGNSKVISLRGKPAFRKVLFSSRRLGKGQHRLKLTTLSSRPAEIDAVAIRP
ncbi:MAG: fibronectin type III domain-containing protein [Thermoleophilaceae bacterium]